MTVTRSKKDRFLFIFLFFLVGKRLGKADANNVHIYARRRWGGVGLTFNHSFKLLASSIQYFYYLHAFAISVME